MAHSLEVIQSLTKMGIPANVYFHFEDCLKELRNRREQVEFQINLYKANQYSLESKQQQQQSNQTDFTSASSCLFSDTNSEISSCMDSNYESDYSANSVQSSRFTLGEKILNTVYSIEENSNITVTNEEMENHPPERQSTIVVNNSDDSDVTIGENVSRKHSEQLDVILSESGNEAVGPKPSESEIGNNNAVFLKSRNLLRQTSDGYMSSNTPLSANSICENPAVNPFFAVPIDTSTPNLEKLKNITKSSVLNTID